MLTRTILGPGALWTFTVLMLAAAPAWAQPAPQAPGPAIHPATPPGQSSNAQQSATQPRSERAFLGVLVAPQRSGFAPGVPGNAGQNGLLVARVADNSPAQKAGVKQNDIITMYDDQKLVSPDQLMRLVRTDKPGRSVNLEVLRDGKPQKIAVTLGTLPAQGAGPQGPGGLGPGAMGPRFPGSLPPAWENIETLTLKKAGDNKLHLEVDFTQKDPTTSAVKTHRYTFEGTPEEIHRKIEENKEMSLRERGQLHRLLLVGSLGGFPMPGGPGMGPPGGFGAPGGAPGNGY